MHREDLDRSPVEEIAIDWERQFMVGREKLEVILAAYTEMGIKADDVYLRKPSIGELECGQECAECFKGNPEALEDCVVVYLRRK